jgi:arsenate reductase
MKWLDASGIRYHSIDIVSSPPSPTTIARLHRQSGLPIARFFNTSGESYRGGGFKDRLTAMSVADARAALAADGKLIKRPLVDAGRVVLVGFDPDGWASALRR